MLQEKFTGIQRIHADIQDKRDKREVRVGHRNKLKRILQGVEQLSA